tara:strand:+ start:1816 stop:2013 length:198 start_codon:yes stop_codon:yes gene_type:complete
LDIPRAVCSATDAGSEAINCGVVYHNTVEFREKGTEGQEYSVKGKKEEHEPTSDCNYWDESLSPG